MMYDKVIRERGEGSITAKLPVKKRIAANEVKYRCQCEGVKAPYCPKPI